MAKEIQYVQAAGHHGSITPRVIKGNLPIQNKDDAFKREIEVFISDKLNQDIPDHCLINTEYINGDNLITRFAINSSLVAVIKKAKSNKEKIAQCLDSLENLLVTEVLEYLTTSNIAIIDMFVRRADLNDNTKYLISSISQLDTHSVVLWKFINDNSNNTQKKIIFVIDPNKGIYSKALHGKIIQLLPNIFSEHYQVSSLLPDDNMTFYTTRGLLPKYIHYGMDNPPPRNCIDIAVKIAFTLQTLLQNPSINICKDVIKYKLLELSNQFYLYDNSKLLSGSALREINSSNIAIRENTKKILQNVLNNKKILPLLSDQGLVNKSIHVIEQSIDKAKNKLNSNKISKVFVINDKEVSSNIPIASDVFIQRRDTNGKLISEAIDELLYYKDKDYVVIESEAGSGKTRFIIEYALDKQNAGKMIKWFNAASSDTMIIEYRIMAHQLGIDIEQIGIHDILTKLNELLSNHPMIFIYDNVDDYQQINLYFSSLPKSVKLIVTQRPEVSTIQNINNISDKYGEKIILGEFLTDAAIEYLEQILPVQPQCHVQEDPMQLTRKNQIDNIITSIGTLPLKLNLAVYYIKDNPRLAISKTIASFQKDHGSIFIKTFDAITKTEISWKLLQHLAYLDSDLICEDVLINVCNIYQENTNHLQDLQLILKYLINTGLIEYQEKGLKNGVKMHRLIQEEILKYTPYNQAEIICNNLVNIFNNLILQDHLDTSSVIAITQFYIRSIIKLLDKFSNSIIKEEKLPTLGLLAEKVGDYYNHITDSKMALQYYKISLDILNQAGINDTKQLSKSNLNIGICYGVMNCCEEEMFYKIKAVHLLQNTVKDNEYVKALQSLAFAYIYSKSPNYLEALKYLDENEIILGKINNPSNDVIIKNLRFKGKCYQHLDQYDTAFDHYQQCIEKIKQLYPEEDKLELAWCYDDLAKLYGSQTKYREQLQYYLLSLKIFNSKMLHVNTHSAGCYYNIASAYKNMKNDNNALAYYSKALNDYKILNMQTKLPKILDELSIIYFKTKQHSKYYESLEESRIIKEKYFPGSRFLAWSYDNLSNYFGYIKHQYQKQISFAQNSINIYQKKIVNQNPDIDKCYYNIYNAYHRLGEYNQAIIALRKSLNIAEDNQLIEFKDDNYGLLAVKYTRLAWLYINLKNYSLAEYYCNQVTPIIDTYLSCITTDDLVVIYTNIAVYYSLRADNAFESNSEYHKLTNKYFNLCYELNDAQLSITYMHHSNFLICQSNFLQCCQHIIKTINLRDIDAKLMFCKANQKMLPDVLADHFQESNEDIVIQAYHYAYYLLVKHYQKFEEHEYIFEKTSQEYLDEFATIVISDTNEHNKNDLYLQYSAILLGDLD